MSKLFMIIMLLGAICYTTTPSQAKTLHDQVDDDESQFDSGEISSFPPPPPSIGNELYIVPTPPGEWDLPSGAIVRLRPPRSPVHHRIPPLRLPPRALVHPPTHYSLSRSPPPTPPSPSIGNELYQVPTPLLSAWESAERTIERPRSRRGLVHRRPPPLLLPPRSLVYPPPHHSPPRSPPPTPIQT
ncbi:hypothetical protein CASFOL_012520 [Castilleja foliolosa]|uniref:Uncharacterized protein n=1 Tax=Castilleja foliolosa TaxID=1961234 RepID=A0ABD3DHD1_9LAMI